MSLWALLMPPPHRAEALSDAFVWRLSDVWRLSVACIGPNSRTESPRKTKIGTEVAHVTRDSDTTFKVKGQLVADVLNSQHAGTGATWWIHSFLTTNQPSSKQTRPYLRIFMKCSRSSAPCLSRLVNVQERSVSALLFAASRHIMRTSMGQERLNGLALLHVGLHYTKDIDINEVHGGYFCRKTCSSIDSCEHLELRLKTLCDFNGYVLVIFWQF